MRVSTADRNEVRTESQRPVLALVGAPNSGKTTLYNWLTRSHYRVVNYPGSTVEYAIGQSAPRLGSSFAVIDTPGTYSLVARSADEEVTLRALTHQHPVGKVTHVGVIVDGTQMERHLLLAKQVQETGLPMILIVTMADLLWKSGLQLRKELLEKEFGCPVVLFDGVLGKGLQDIAEALKKTPPKQGTPQTWAPWTASIQAAKQKGIHHLVADVLVGAGLKKIYQRTENWDRFLMHPVLGLLIFFAVMTVIFTSIYWLAAPAMDLIDGTFSWAAESVTALGPDILLFRFLGEGLMMAFSSVFVFVPQIFILFLGIGFLEGTGYLARAATLIDRPFAALGLSGRSFVPLLSGFACAVPAMMATRNLSSRRDRWITNAIIPLMTCSARLPVYALLLGFLFLDRPAWQAGLALAALYFGALVVGAIAAGILNRLIPAQGRSFFMMELPLYRWPRWPVLLRQSLKRTRSYVERAGPAIFVFAVLIWFGAHFPRVDEAPQASPVVETASMENAAAESGAPKAADDPQATEFLAESHQLEQSYLGRMGHWLDPVVAPMGVDWRVGVGMVSAFAAREVFVSSLALIFNVAGDEEVQAAGLLKTMGEAKMADGSPVFTTASVIGLLIFFMIALQCMSTFVISQRENGSWTYALIQLVALNLVAYGLAVAAVQGLRALGVA